MPGFPVLLKTWQAPYLASLPQESTVIIQHGKGVVGMKNAFLASPSPWVMKNCSDSTATSTITDLIVDNTSIVNSAGGAHSWFVLRNTVTGLEFCVDLNQTDNQTITTATSFGAGFTGGSTTARPTATDEATIGVANIWWYGGSGVGRFRIVLLHSTDGQITYAFILYQGIITSAWCFGQMVSHHSSWTPPLIGFLQGSNTLASSALNTGSRLRSTDQIMARAAAGTMMLRWTGHYAHGNLLELTATARESPTGKWQFWAIGLACKNSPRRGKHGMFVDSFRLPNSIPAGWIFRSDDGSQALMSIGAGWAIPWSPSVPPRVF